MAGKFAIKNHPGVSMFKVKYIVRRGPHKGKERVYAYYKARSIWRTNHPRQSPDFVALVQ
jgi:hypothetical protein